MSRLGILMLVTTGVLLSACGGGGDVQGETSAGDKTDVTATAGDGDAGGGIGGGGDTGVVVEVDGEEYVVDTELGGSCDTEGDTETGNDLSAYGYDVETGLRVELSFDRQSAEFSPSGQEEFYGRLFIALAEGGSWKVASMDPWSWLSDDRSRVVGTVTMEDSDGQSVDVSFDVTCP